MEDAQAPLGVGATDTAGRLLASLGGGGPVDSQFVPCADVPRAGVLVALPALLGCGLLTQTEKHFSLPSGYYQLVHVFVLTAFLALSRLKNLEALRYCAPGEWGKVLGLDRIPEVRTLRQKLDQLGQPEQVGPWAAALAADWMAADPQAAGTLYVDGHVRVYHGQSAHLPKHYVSRQRLCLRASTDYWINAGDGQPFFVVHAPVDPGLLQVLEKEIIPRLEKDVPNQPTAEQLAADPALDKFTVVFDREGYSPDALQRLKARRIAALTYHKHPGADWPGEEFQTQSVALAHGNQEEMQLAERATQLSNGLGVREIRHLDRAGHQTSIICTNEKLGRPAAAATMFGRWSQENFLKYARQHYALDHLIQHQTQPLPETTRVVNPAWRTLDGQRRSLSAKLKRQLVKFATLSLATPIEPARVEAFLRDKTTAQAQVQALETQLQEVKTNLKATDRHVQLKDLPVEQRYTRLSVGAQDLVDTIKLIAYRAETAMSHLVREEFPAGRRGEERRLLQSLYVSEANLLPDLDQGTLTVQLHYPANPMIARVVQALCVQLTATETLFPTTKLRLVYEVLGADALLPETPIIPDSGAPQNP